MVDLVEEYKKHREELEIYNKTTPKGLNKQPQWG